MRGYWCRSFPDAGVGFQAKANGGARAESVDYDSDYANDNERSRERQG